MEQLTIKDLNCSENLQPTNDLVLVPEDIPIRPAPPALPAPPASFATPIDGMEVFLEVSFGSVLVGVN